MTHLTDATSVVFSEAYQRLLNGLNAEGLKLAGDRTITVVIEAVGEPQ